MNYLTDYLRIQEEKYKRLLGISLTICLSRFIITICFKDVCSIAFSSISISSKALKLIFVCFAKKTRNLKQSVICFIYEKMCIKTKINGCHFIRVCKGVYKGERGAEPPPRTQSFHTFHILNSRVKNIKIFCCSFSALRRLYT